MKLILKHLLIFLGSVLLGTVNAQTANVLVYGKHTVNPTTHKKNAEYKFEINNSSSTAIMQLEIGCYNPDESKIQTQFTYQWKPFGNGNFGIDKSAQRTTAIFPTGWQFEVQEVHGEANYCLELSTTSDQVTYAILAGKSTKNTGQNFIFRLPKLDSNYVTAYAKYRYDAPVIRAQSFDTTPPRLSYHLETHQHGKHHHIKHRHGWTQVEIEDVRITDNYDPHPVVLLTSVTSKDKDFKPEDVDAVYNEETKSFWVKRVPNRQYTVTYTGMDASGNKVAVSRNIWAH
jgi:hypothetical protein